MTNREFFLDRRRAEQAAFLKVLRAIPADQLSYTPHVNSPTAGQLAQTIAFGVEACVNVATNFRSEWKSAPVPSLEDIVATFERESGKLMERVSAMSESDWERNSEFFVNGKKVAEYQVGTFLWFILFDHIHHRGQLSTYLRPMGAKVPSIYGPSGDERG